MVAVLDTWKEPVYLSRVWTIFEQFVASKLQITVAFVMPESSTVSVREQISLGDVGIKEITESVSRVDSARAEARKQEDEINVKTLIRETVGFHRVDAHVTEAMVRWIGGVVNREFQKRIGQAKPAATVGWLGASCKRKARTKSLGFAGFTGLRVCALAEQAP